MKEGALSKTGPAGDSASTAKIVLIVLAVWLATAIVVAASGVIEDPPRAVPPILIWGPVVVFLVAFTRVRVFQMWSLELDLRWLILYNVVRVGVGAGFVVMSGEELPAEFALFAGWGDIAVGATALMAVFCVPALTVLRRRMVFAWNLFGLLDMLMVFVTAQRLILFGSDPNPLIELTRFPLLIVPMFVVPLVLITHFAVFAQLWHTRGR